MPLEVLVVGVVHPPVPWVYEARAGDALEEKIEEDTPLNHEIRLHVLKISQST